MTSMGRQPKNIKIWISQQPLAGFFSNFKLKLWWPNQNHKCLKGRRPSMEEDLKILKVEYLSNHWSDFPQILNLSLGNWTKVHNRKAITNGRRPQNIKGWISQQPLLGSSSNLKLKLTANGRQHQNIKAWIYQQPLVGFSTNFKLKLRGPNQNWKCLKRRRHPMEDNLKKLKVEYLSNHWSDLPKILKLCLGNWTKIRCLKRRRPPMEEDLKILKVEYLSNHWSDFPQILNLSSEDQDKIKNTWNEDNLQ